MQGLHLSVVRFRSLSCLPRPFVGHAMSEHGPNMAHLEVMDRELFWGIMTRGEVVSALLGFWIRCSSSLA
jgi:uncharacterized membrane protein